MPENAHARKHCAYLIHRRKYTDSRRLVELFTKTQGRVSAVYRQGRSKKALPLPQAFTPLLVSWQGQGALKTLTLIEPLAPPVALDGTALYCGLYLNELLERVLPPEDACEEIYQLYHDTLAQIGQTPAQAASIRLLTLEVVLRYFELRLLDYLGFAINFYQDTQQQEIIDADAAIYYYRLYQGFERVQTPVKGRSLVSGKTLTAIRQGDFAQPEARHYAKRLCRQTIQALLGEKPLKARELFH